MFEGMEEGFLVGFVCVEVVGCIKYGEVYFSGIFNWGGGLYI